MKTKYKMRIRG